MVLQLKEKHRSRNTANKSSQPKQHSTVPPQRNKISLQQGKGWIATQEQEILAQKSTAYRTDPTQRNMFEQQSQGFRKFEIWKFQLLT